MPFRTWDLSESVFQVVQGNYERAAGTLEAYSKGNFPQNPDVIRTPRSGNIITHRVGVHLPTELNPAQSPNVLPMTPRATAEPGVNAWLNDLLPSMEDVACQVSYIDPISRVENTTTLTQRELGLQPIDLLYLVHTENEQAMSALDDCILHHFRQNNYLLRPDTDIQINYVQPISGKVNFFELSALLRSVRSLVQQSRPLKSSDVRLAQEASTASEGDVFLDSRRITLVRDQLTQWRDQLANFPLIALTADEATLAANQAQILSQIDAYANQLLNTLHEVSLFGNTPNGTRNGMGQVSKNYGSNCGKSEGFTGSLGQKTHRLSGPHDPVSGASHRYPR